MFQNRFLPAPVPLRRLYDGPTVPKVNDAKNTDKFAGLWQRMSIDKLVPESKYEVLPYDTYCPSLKSKVDSRVCKKCGIYYPSIAAMKRHHKAEQSKSDKEIDEHGRLDNESDSSIDIEYNDPWEDRYE